MVRTTEESICMLESLPHETNANRPRVSGGIMKSQSSQPFCTMVVNTQSCEKLYPKTWTLDNWRKGRHRSYLCKTFCRTNLLRQWQFTRKSNTKGNNLLSINRWRLKPKKNKKLTGATKSISTRSMTDIHSILKNYYRGIPKWEMDISTAHPWLSTVFNYQKEPPQFIPIRAMWDPSVEVEERRSRQDGEGQCSRAHQNWIGVAYRFCTERGRQSAVLLHLPKTQRSHGP